MQKNTTLLFFLLLAHSSFSQKKDSTKSSTHFSGSVSVTHNGISLIPTFSLGKGAAIVLLSAGKKKLSFEPDMRFALEGKPWSFLFWWRYKLVNSENVKITLGAHPALNFRTMKLPVNGDSADVIVTRRFLAGELSPNYQFSKNTSIGLYYLFSRGFDKNVAKHTHFITLNCNISNINLPGNLKLRVHPQVYYLNQDNQDGFFFSSTFILGKKSFPFSASAIINKRIESDITGSKNFVWNASLIYSFSKKYAEN